MVAVPIPESLAHGYSGKAVTKGFCFHIIERSTDNLLQASVSIDFRELLRVRHVSESDVELRLLDHLGEHKLISTQGGQQGRLSCAIADSWVFGMKRLAVAERHHGKVPAFWRKQCQCPLGKRQCGKFVEGILRIDDVLIVHPDLFSGLPASTLGMETCRQ